MKFALLAAAAMTLLVPVGAQAATPVTFNGICAASATSTQAACSPNLYGGYGNTVTLAGTNDSTLQVKISAWQSNQTTGAITTAFLGAYSGGFGVTGVQDVYGGQAGQGGTHQIDNVNGYSDFVVLQFNRAVHLEGLDLNLYDLTGLTSGTSKDSDASIYNAAALTPAMWNTTVNASALAFDPSNYYEVAGTSAAGTRGPNANALAYNNAANSTYGTKFSQVWLVGASAFVNDKNDGFKLGQFFVTAATPAVPEPATWAMMIAGFGLVGATMRRRVRSANASQLA